jgi:RNA polymerase sigma-70 factor (ECF subfamily)
VTLTADEDRRDVARVLGGDRDAFAVLVERHQGRLIAHLARLAGRDDAEDLAQETFVRAFGSLMRYDAAYPFRGWLLVIASRLAANHAAKRRERLLGDALDQAGGGARDDPARELAEADDEARLLARIDRALADLPAESRALYELRFRQELPLDELAHHFGLTVNAMKVRIHRLRRALAERLGLDVDAGTEEAP